MTVSKYAKAIVVLVADALYSLGAALSDDAVTNAEWVTIGSGVLVAIAVYLVPNTDTV